MMDIDRDYTGQLPPCRLASSSSGKSASAEQPGQPEAGKGADEAADQIAGRAGDA